MPNKFKRLFRFGGNYSDQREPDIIDLDEKIKEAAWPLVEYPVCCYNNSEKCKRSKYKLKIDWNYITREDELGAHEIRKDLLTTEATKDVSLFETVLQNDDKESQQFTFKTQRSTTSTYELSIQESVCIEANFNLNFSLGKALPSASIGGKVSWTGTVGEKMTKSECLTWGMDSQIVVQGNSKTIATLGIKEENTVIDLEILSIIRATSLSGLIPVYVIRKSDNVRIHTVRVSVEDICETSDKFTFNENEPNILRFKTKGILSAVYGVKQFVTVTPERKVLNHGNVNIEEIPEEDEEDQAVNNVVVAE